MKKQPMEKKNSNASIAKVSAIAREILQQTAAESAHVHISNGNVKLGAIANVSTPPVMTCHNCSNCKGYCYAVRSFLRASSVQKAWSENYALFVADPDRYFAEISRAVRLERFFRWHVSGDIINRRYLQGMVDVALENENCEFLAFTKAYEIVDSAVSDGLEIPCNLHVLFSAAPEVTMENPYHFPECHIVFADESKDTYHGGANYEFHCGGNCTECAINGCGCFFLHNGDVVLINQH